MDPNASSRRAAASSNDDGTSFTSLSSASRGPGFARTGSSWQSESRKRAMYGRLALPGPVRPERAPGQRAPTDPEVQVAGSRGPGLRLPGLAHPGNFAGIHLGPGAPTRDHAPADVALVVDVVDLEGQHGVAAIGPHDAVRRGTHDDRVLEDGVVHRHDVRAVRRRKRYAADDAGAQESFTLPRIQLMRLRHVRSPLPMWPRQSAGTGGRVPSRWRDTSIVYFSPG